MNIDKIITTPILLVFLIICAGSFQAFAQDEKNSQVYSVDDCIRMALDNNWSVKSKEEKIDEAVYVKKQAESDFFPTISTSYGYTRLSEVRRSKAIPLGPGAVIPASDLNSQGNFQWSATVSQPIFTGFALTSAHELAKLGIDQSVIALELEKLDLALSVKNVYFNILKADKGVDVAEKAIKSLASHVEVARNFYDVGMIPVNDLLKAEVELSNAQHNLVKVLNASQFSRASLNMLLSKPINESFDIEDMLVFKNENSDFGSYLARALEKRPEIKALELNIIQVEHQVKLARSKYFPQIALSYNYVKEGNDITASGSGFHDANSWQAMAGLSWTIWDWNKTDNSVSEKKSLKRQLIQTRKAIEDGIRLELKKAFLDLEETEKNIPTSKKAVSQAEENLRVSQERYKAQVTTSTEVLDAQTLLSQARTNYYNALYDHKLAKAALLRSIGEY